MESVTVVTRMCLVRVFTIDTNQGKFLHEFRGVVRTEIIFATYKNVETNIYVYIYVL